MATLRSLGVSGAGRFGGWTLALPGSPEQLLVEVAPGYRAVGLVARAAALRVRSTAMVTAIATTAIVASNA